MTRRLVFQSEQVWPPTEPKWRLPAGACDCHIHISDASGRFPILRKTHPPPHATAEMFRSMLDTTGLERGVAVQLMAYGDDNGAMLEALARTRGLLCGVAELTQGATDSAMERLHALGVRGLRFYLEPPKPIAGLRVRGVSLADLMSLAPRMKALGWVAEISAGCETIALIASELESLGIPIVLEHMAGCTAVRGIADPSVRAVIALLGSGAFWVKLTVCAMSDRFPDYEDLRPVHDALVRAAPERMLWGSNWPHAMPVGTAPESGHLLDLFDEWIEHDVGLRRVILSDNPARLFGFQRDS